MLISRAVGSKFQSAGYRKAASRVETMLFARVDTLAFRGTEEGRRRDGGGTEEGRRRDGGGTEPVLETMLFVGVDTLAFGGVGRVHVEIPYKLKNAV
jgi:hypothetical protein